MRTSLRPPKCTMLIDAEVAKIVRRLAGYEGRRLSVVLADMTSLYVQTRWPTLDLSSSTAPVVLTAPTKRRRDG